MHRLLIAALISTAAFATGCKKGDEAAPMPKSEPLAASMPDPAGKTVTYAIEPKSKTAIDMPAPKERIKAETEGAKGQLHVDLASLGKTRGDIYIDVATLSTHTFGNDDDKTQTHHALTWLQVDETMSDAAEREKNRWAHFAIRSIDGLSAPDAKSIAPQKEGNDDVRTVSLTAHGDFELHQHAAKAPKDVQLDVKMHYPAGAPADSKPTSIEIKTRSPLVITLADHDVKPRDSQGIIAQKAFGLLGTKVADVANVSIDLRAQPGS
jgi:hypothetical protein